MIASHPSTLNAGILGAGWVTPLGCELESVWKSLAAGAIAESRPVQNPETGRLHQVRAVPAKLVEHLARSPRLRRSSPISYFAVAAAMAALENAGLSPSPELGKKTALIFAVSNGGVIYTRRFYEQLLKQGANAASPLLFSETVYNAPASHLAAALGLDGATYTLVGDNSVGLAALHFGIQLLTLGSCEYALVVGCEEIDWILCEAFHDWRLARTPLAEGAGAIVLTLDAPLRLSTSAGIPFLRQKDAASALRIALGDSRGELIVSSANGTFADRAEREILGNDRRCIYPKHHLGEAPGASALWQVIAAALALNHRVATSALVPVVGFNQQAAVATLA